MRRLIISALNVFCSRLRKLNFLKPPIMCLFSPWTSVYIFYVFFKELLPKAIRRTPAEIVTSLAWVIYLLHFHKRFSTSSAHAKVKFSFLELAFYCWLWFIFTEFHLVGSVCWITLDYHPILRSALGNLHQSEVKDIVYFIKQWQQQGQVSMMLETLARVCLVYLLHIRSDNVCIKQSSLHTDVLLDSAHPVPSKPRIFWHPWIYPSPCNTLDVFSTSSVTITLSPVLLALLFIATGWKCCLFLSSSCYIYTNPTSWSIGLTYFQYFHM